MWVPSTAVNSKANSGNINGWSLFHTRQLSLFVALILIAVILSILPWHWIHMFWIQSLHHLLWTIPLSCLHLNTNIYIASVKPITSTNYFLANCTCLMSRCVQMTWEPAKNSVGLKFFQSRFCISNTYQAMWCFSYMDTSSCKQLDKNTTLRCHPMDYNPEQAKQEFLS